MRLFVALELSTEDRHRLRPLIESACAAYPGGRIVPFGNLHITLHFVGECGPDKAEQLRRALWQAYRADADRENRLFPMRLQASGSGLFRSGREAVLWLRVEPSAGIRRFRTMLFDALERMGWPTETRHELIPHITIARCVPVGSGNGRDPGSPSPAAHPAVCPLTAAGPSLMESVRQDGRLSYIARCRPAVGPEWIPGNGT
ncbi:MAG: RNA 2',3'-cyclic phosphodiesterase [Clostridia bacterium]|nr:RNA 2',3'-cyclic phosphodiesterase [Clostridia bacterium]